MNRFNEAQLTAIHHGQGPMMVLAGPGSGKTTVITHRVKELIEQEKISPSNILVVTFTKAAATEMKSRFRQIMDDAYLPVTFGTFHGVFFSILGHAYGYKAANIVDEGRKQTILRELVQEQHMETEDENTLIDNLRKEIGYVKGEMSDPAYYYPQCCAQEIFQDIYQGYDKALKKYGLLDFDDMMVYTWQLFDQRKDILQAWQNKFQYILIDEFQDVNRLQYEIVKQLAGQDKNLFIVGDDDQSIYHFRGARPEFMLNFEKDFPGAKKVILNINYRSTQPIVDVAERCICHNTKRFNKGMKAVSKIGTPVSVKVFKGPLEECTAVADKMIKLHNEGMSYNNMAVLFRTNFGSRMMVQQLIQHNIPFQMKDHLPNLYEHWIMKNIEAYIRIARGGSQRSDYLQIINRPNRYISRQSFEDSVVDFEKVKTYYEDKDWMLQRLEDFQEDLHMLETLPPYGALNYLRRAMGYESFLYEYAMEHGIAPEDLIEIYETIEESAKAYKSYGAWFEYIEDYRQKIKTRQNDDKNQNYGIILSTMHSAKGLEYDAVFILDVNEKVIPYQKAALKEEIEEERRMFYVAMTRARRVLDIYYVKERCSKVMEASPFIYEILEKDM